MVVTGPDGSFGLEFYMIVKSAHLPTESAWKYKAPSWAKELWPVIREELEIWCQENYVKFIIDETASVYPVD